MLWLILASAAPYVLHPVHICLKETPPHIMRTELLYGQPTTETLKTLGVEWDGFNAVLRVWSPHALKMRIKLYHNDLGGEPFRKMALEQVGEGVWECNLDSTLYGTYYTLQAKFNGRWGVETPDPYAKAVGRNGLRAHLIDPTLQRPQGWEYDRSPYFDTAADAVIYELHVRDFSVHPESGMVHKGKFLAFTERGTTNAQGKATGVDHLLELGITHVHLLPSFDFLSVDESKPQEAQYNWGYDPQNYNVPEGSYSTNAADGAVRIREFREMVMALHQAGLRVVMDVVFNHTGTVDGLAFEALTPGYFYRTFPDGRLSNGSGCGNEMASERPMVRRFMVESLKYWMQEYHIDGFRFDLMALHDLETMRTIERELRSIKPDVLLYGEGWTAGASPLPEANRALKHHMMQLPGVAAFCDDLRDGVKGSWANHSDTGFVGGNYALKESVKFGIVGAIWHPQISYGWVNASKEPWANEPIQCINYVSCHDNHTLYDRFKLAHPNADNLQRQRMQILANAIVLTSQGIPFLHAGVEFMRTKNGVENSYNSPDHINWLDWSRKADYPDVVAAYKNLITMRKAHPVFKLGRPDEVRKRLLFIDTPPHVIGYHLDGEGVDTWSKVLVYFNGDKEPTTVPIAEGQWKVAWYGSSAHRGANEVSSELLIPPFGAVILHQ
jgi:pullulanase